MILAAAASDLTLNKWLFDVSESTAGPIAGGFVVAIVAKWLGFAPLRAIGWVDVFTIAVIVLGGATASLFIPYGGHPIAMGLLMGLLICIPMGLWSRRMLRRLGRLRRQQRRWQALGRAFDQTGRGYRDVTFKRAR